MGALFMKKNFGVKYVKIDVGEENGTMHFRTTFGAMKQSLVKGFDGGPIRIENSTIPVLNNLKHCHTDFWTYNDHGKNFEYKDRCGSWADFVFEAEDLLIVFGSPRQMVDAAALARGADTWLG